MLKNTPVAKLSDIPLNGTHRVMLSGKAVLLCNVDGAIYAIEDVCTHDGGALDQGELEGCRIMCPRHGAYFDVTTGAALTHRRLTRHDVPRKRLGHVRSGRRGCRFVRDDRQNRSCRSVHKHGAQGCGAGCHAPIIANKY